MRRALLPLVALLVASCTVHDSAPVAPLIGGKASTETSSWIPGDDVPGWYDYDCPEPGASGAEILLDWPSVYTLGAGFDGSASDGPHGFSMEFADCVEDPCPGRRGSDPFGRLMSETPPELYGDRAQGWHTTDAGGDIRALFQNIVAVMWDTTANSKFPHAVEVEICFSRVRPDHVRGIVYVYQDEKWTFLDPYYGNHHYSFTFDALIPERGAYAPDGDPSCQHPFDVQGYEMARFYDYDASDAGDGSIVYDAVWPWDDITDPDVRTDLYDAYYPCGQDY